jgi:hypothetical protein
MVVFADNGSIGVYCAYTRLKADGVRFSYLSATGRLRTTREELHYDAWCHTNRGSFTSTCQATYINHPDRLMPVIARRQNLGRIIVMTNLPRFILRA